MKIHVIIDGAYQWNYWHDKSTRCWWCANVEVTGVPALSARPVDCRVGRQTVKRSDDD